MREFIFDETIAADNGDIPHYFRQLRVVEMGTFLIIFTNSV